ncbi:hypothetical protein BHE74_00039201 [Ensete ventricosum]|nr:hypothetical protein BHE74_00039201 [Ensete ventricosum]
MSSASSHFESRSIKISAHRSRVLSRPSGYSVSVAIVPSSNALGDSWTTDALVVMQSLFYCRLNRDNLSVGRGEEELFHSGKVATEQPTDASGSTARTSIDKGKGTVELNEVPKRGYTMRELCKGPLSEEYLRGALHPTLAKQVYECSSEEFMNRADKLAVWGLHFVSALIDRVHDAGQLVRNQHEKILALRAVNKELKASVGQELATIVERRVKELEAEIKRMLLN